MKTGCLIIEVAEELVFEESSCRFKSSIIKYWYKNKNRKVVRRKFDIMSLEVLIVKLLRVKTNHFKNCKDGFTIDFVAR